jgi:hypothetical protein
MTSIPPPIKALISTALAGMPVRTKISRSVMMVEFSFGNMRCDLSILSKESINASIVSVLQCSTVRSVTITVTREQSLLVMPVLAARTDLTRLTLGFEPGADIVCRDHLARTIRNNPLIQISLLGVPSSDEISLRDAFSDHRTLRKVFCSYEILSPAAMITIVERNRSIMSFDYSWHSDLDEIESARLLRALRDNWVLTDIQTHNMALNAKARAVTDENTTLDEFHEICTQLAIVLLPLESSGQLCPYEMLWIIDWLPPMSTRYVWAPDGVNVDYSYDPYHGKKIALISGIVNSYRRVLENRD